MREDLKVHLLGACCTFPGTRQVYGHLEIPTPSSPPGGKIPAALPPHGRDPPPHTHCLSHQHPLLLIHQLCGLTPSVQGVPSPFSPFR